MSKLITICGSAGSIPHIQHLFSSLPKTYPIPIVVLLHMQQNRDATLVPIFKDNIQLSLSVPEDNDEITANHIYLAPSMYHLQIEKDYRFSFALDEPPHFSIPSVNILLETAASAYKDQLTAIIFSGASEDGKESYSKVEQLGSTILIQSPEEAPFKTMVLAAIQATKNPKILHTSDIIKYILEIGGTQNDI